MRWGASRSAISASLVLSLLLSACDIQFTPDIVPLELATLPPQGFQPGVIGGTPGPSPVPLAPTPSPHPPTPVPFQGADDLDCEGPIGGDNHFGYCSIPNSDLYYVWGECSVPCPEGEYPGIEIRAVEDSSAYRDFVDAVNMRTTVLVEKRDSRRWAGGLALAETVGGGLALQGAKCLVGAKFTFGATCIGLAITIGAGAVAIVKSVTDYLSADRELNRDGGLNDAARNRFDELQHVP